jgi:predicted transcriptional regulator
MTDGPLTDLEGDEMTTKTAVLEMIQRMPDDVTVPDIMAELYVRQKVDEGLRQLEEGQGIEHEEVKKRLSKWLE